MVDCERIGTSNYYWAFPSKVLHARKRKLEELQQQVTDQLEHHQPTGSEATKLNQKQDYQKQNYLYAKHGQRFCFLGWGAVWAAPVN